MRNVFVWGWVCLSLLLLVGCQYKSTLFQGEYLAGHLLRLNIKADSRLNLYDSKANRLYMVLYQLTDLNAFDRLAQDADGVQKLLETKLFDPSILAVNSKIVHAGENLTIILERAEKAKYFVIVTGYYGTMNNADLIRRHRFQVKRKRVGFWRNKYQCTPCDLDIELVLGPHKIASSSIVEKGCTDECQ